LRARNTWLGFTAIIVGLLLGVAYPYVLVALPPSKAVEVIIYTAIAISIVLGAFIGAVGIILARGLKVEDEHEDTGEE